MARGLVLSIVKKSCKKIVARCTIGVPRVIALLLKKLLTKLMRTTQCYDLQKKSALVIWMKTKRCTIMYQL